MKTKQSIPAQWQQPHPRGSEPIDCDESLSLSDASFESVYHGFLDHILSVYAERRTENERHEVKKLLVVNAKKLFTRHVIDMAAIEKELTAEDEGNIYYVQLKNAKKTVRHLRQISEELKSIRTPQAFGLPESRGSAAMAQRQSFRPKPCRNSNPQLRSVAERRVRLDPLSETPAKSARPSVSARKGSVQTTLFPSLTNSFAKTQSQNALTTCFKMKEQLMAPLFDKTAERDSEFFESISSSKPRRKRRLRRHLPMTMRRRETAAKQQIDQAARIYGMPPVLITTGETMYSTMSRSAAENCVLSAQCSPTRKQRTRLRLVFTKNHPQNV